MALTQEQVDTFNELTLEKRELEVELNRINDFNSRPQDNRDNARAINQGKIFVKFAGTACMLPVEVFKAELTKRKTALKSRLTKIDNELKQI